MVVLAEAVAFAWVEDKLHGLAAVLERAVVLHRLSDRNALVVAAVQNEQRRGHVVDEGDRRALAIELHRLLVRHALEERGDVAGNVGGAVHAHEVEEASALHRRLEAVRLGHDPGGHVAAVAPARHPELVGIGDATRYHRVDAGHDVAIVSATPVGDVAAHPLLAIAGRAAWIGIEHGPSLPRPVLSGRAPIRLEADVVRARRTAMDIHEQRVALTGAVADGLEQHTLDFLAIGTLPRNGLALA